MDYGLQNGCDITVGKTQSAILCFCPKNPVIYQKFPIINASSFFFCSFFFLGVCSTFSRLNSLKK